MNKAQQARFDSLYEQRVNALHRQGKAERTIDSYARAARRIAHFFDHSWSTVKIDRNGLQFFYQHVLDQQWVWVDIVKPPQKKVLPDILTVNEVERVINGTRELRYQTFILTAYSVGLRIGETLNLTVGDIDSERMKVHVRLGKGKKGQVFAPAKPANGKTDKLRHGATKPMDRGGLQKSFKVIVKSCGIHKHITPHSLRHCYGAHLVEAGLNLRAIQQEMGHECPKTTALYTQLTDVVDQNTSKVINKLVNRLKLKLDGEV